ncbi:hypothetical protein FKZ61_022325 [Litorilinea aerophila]|uniref:DUF2085 domain-containing protein n=1 Tax=Litorilinea aerophila TaxID=1204385 RepID=A0A540V918_9CHLR|nr:hypothetical protein [Litorilinea aerophila]MCC9078835.1 hypothetical protein [Litorilinea aerophila]
MAVYHPTESRTISRADRLVCGVLRHWLAWLLTPLLIFVTLPFLAPVFMALGWQGLGTAIYTLFIPFCHQLPQRSLFLFGAQPTYTLAEIMQVYPTADPWQLRFFYGTPEMGWKVAWSDRMVSFYFMTPVFGLLYAMLRRWGRSVRPLSVRALLLLLLPLALDGGTHLLSDLMFGISSGGFRDTNAWLAWLTGNAWPGFYAGDHLGTFNWWMRLWTGVLAAWGIAFFTFPRLDRLFAAEVARYCRRQRR